MEQVEVTIKSHLSEITEVNQVFLLPHKEGVIVIADDQVSFLYFSLSMSIPSSF